LLVGQEHFVLAAVGAAAVAVVVAVVALAASEQVGFWGGAERTDE